VAVGIIFDETREERVGVGAGGFRSRSRGGCACALWVLLGSTRKRLRIHRNGWKARVLPGLKAFFEHEDGFEPLARKPQRRTGAARVLGSGAVGDDRGVARQRGRMLDDFRER